MADHPPDVTRGVVPLVLVAAVVTMVTFGFAEGVWWSNLHNGLLALAFTLVGAYVLFQRPGHRVGVWFLATGLVEAVMFLGRQVAHATEGSSASQAAIWWGWLGVWPVALGLGLTTASVLVFPDGRLPSPRWRPVAVVVGILTGACAVLSALWPVEYDATGVTTPHPFDLPGAEVASTVWSAIAHPSYALLLVLWVVAVVLRWRGSGAVVRRQLLILAVPVAFSALVLLAGLALSGSPRAGVLAATLVPVGAGWAVVHAQHRVAYGALSWLSRVTPASSDLPTDLARALSEALTSQRAVLWVGDAQRLDAIGVWPPTEEDLPGVGLDELRASGVEVREVRRGEAVIGAVSVERGGAPLSLAEGRLLDDLAAQGAWVIEHVDLADAAARRDDPRPLTGLTPRERDVLGLMARGLTNAAICEELHLSIKTVEPAVGRIFDKLGLHADAASNRRVLAVLAYVHREV